MSWKEYSMGVNASKWVICGPLGNRIH